MIKPFWTSKTVWVNVIALAAAVTGAMGIDLGLTMEAQTSLVGGIMAIANIALRFMTKSKVSLGR